MHLAGIAAVDEIAQNNPPNRDGPAADTDNHDTFGIEKCFHE
jgi:hypothetical protein